MYPQQIFVHFVKNYNRRKTTQAFFFTTKSSLQHQCIISIEYQAVLPLHAGALVKPTSTPIPKIPASFFERPHSDTTNFTKGTSNYTMSQPT